MSKEFDKVVTEFFRDYEDRGMVKWQGFMLSDHVAAMARTKKAQSEVYEKKRPMSLDEIDSILAEAYINRKTVCIQVNELNMNGCYSPDIVGKVEGYYDKQVIVLDQLLFLEDINNVQILDQRKKTLEDA